MTSRNRRPSGANWADTALGCAHHCHHPLLSSLSPYSIIAWCRPWLPQLCSSIDSHLVPLGHLSWSSPANTVQGFSM